VSTTPSRIGIVGGGWRASAYFEIAKAFPAHFNFVRALVRSQSSADALNIGRGIAATTSIDAFLDSENFDYVVVCTPSSVTADYIVELANRGIAVLAETPPATDLKSLDHLYSRLNAGARVQVAEQYRFQPQHAARLAVAQSGLLGTVTSVYASVAHDYHGISLLRSILGVGGEPITVRAETFVDPVVATLGRGGWASELEVNDSTRVTARISVPGRGLLGVYEFNGEQYFSPIRSRHLSVFGERGELIDNAVHYMRGRGDAVTLHLERDQTGVDGDLSGSYLRRISAGERVLYENPFAPGRLSDDEIAIGTVLLKMNEFVTGGPSFYGLADASQDAYLGFLISEAAKSGDAVHSTPRVWTSELGGESDW